MEKHRRFSAGLALGAIALATAGLPATAVARTLHDDVVGSAFDDMFLEADMAPAVGFGSWAPVDGGIVAVAGAPSAAFAGEDAAAFRVPIGPFVDGLAFVGGMPLTGPKGGGENTPVPEPGTWLLTIMGLGVAGAALRRRLRRARTDIFGLS